MNRRNFLAACSSSALLGVGGCIDDAGSVDSGDATDDRDGGTKDSDDEDDEHACTREAWNVVLYNESDDPEPVDITILDSEDRTVFSDTVEIAPDTDQFTGVKPGIEVYYDRSYTFEAALSGGNTVSKETVVNCGRVYIFVTESGDLGIRDDSHDGD